GGSLESAKRKINQVSKFTDIKAEIKTNGNKQRLVLVSFRNNVNINDPKKLLLNLYQAGKINNADNSFIQVISKNRRSVRINYTTVGSNSIAKNLLKDAFNGADNVKYIKNSAALVNLINAINEIDTPNELDIPEELDALNKDKAKNLNSIPEVNDYDDIEYDLSNYDFMQEEDFNFSFSASDILWGIASSAYEATKETISYGYNTANSYLFSEDK
ncbi:MAG: hypothetical protein AAF673_00280, partial [Pseudomonadota bacterium]